MKTHGLGMTLFFSADQTQQGQAGRIFGQGGHDDAGAGVGVGTGVVMIEIKSKKPADIREFGRSHVP